MADVEEGGEYGVHLVKVLNELLDKPIFEMIMFKQKFVCSYHQWLKVEIIVTVRYNHFQRIQTINWMEIKIIM